MSYPLGTKKVTLFMHPPFLYQGSIYKMDSPRCKLSENWAGFRNILKRQPLDDVCRYFGVKIAMYYAWLGFYTNMLVLPSIVGVLAFLQGFVFYTDSSYM